MGFLNTVKHKFYLFRAFESTPTAARLTGIAAYVEVRRKLDVPVQQPSLKLDWPRVVAVHASVISGADYHVRKVLACDKEY